MANGLETRLNRGSREKYLRGDETGWDVDR